MASSKKAIYAAILGNFAIAVTKFFGAAVSGSSAMLAEGIHSLVLDGIASIVIGLILCGVAAFLIWESKKLLIGEAASPEIRNGLHHLAEDDPDVTAVGRLLTMHMGPHSLLLNMNLQFRDALDADGVEAAIDRLEQAIREKNPSIQYIFIEADSISGRNRTNSSSPTDDPLP